MVELHAETGIGKSIRITAGCSAEVCNEKRTCLRKFACTLKRVVSRSLTACAEQQEQRGGVMKSSAA